MKLDPHHLAGEGVATAFDGRADCFRRTWMRAEGCVDAFEDPGVSHDDLAADRFFCWGAEHRHPPLRSSFDRRFQADSSRDASNGDQIVPTTMPNSWQRIVFGKKGDAWTRVSCGRGERRWQIGNIARHRESLVLEEFGAGGATLEL